LVSDKDTEEKAILREKHKGAKGETGKANARRKEEGWFDKYAPPHLSGIDIGCGHDPLNATFHRYDKIFGSGNAQLMKDIPDNKYHTVYTSHVLEHMSNPIITIKNWHRICKANGHIIVIVPHRDLYEKRKTLPSKFNGDHKTFWFPIFGELPHTRGLKQTIIEALLWPNIVCLRVLDEGFRSRGTDIASWGEYSIEAIIKKTKPIKAYL